MKIRSNDKNDARTFKSRLLEDLRDPAFKANYLKERHALQLAMNITKLREQKSLESL